MRRLIWLFLALLLALPAWAYTDSELDEMLGPVALYPDPLLAQMLPASTYPDQIQAATTWLAENPTGAGAESLPYDASVIALVHYADVLNMMNQNLDWTTAVGDAYMDNSEAVMNSIQRLRSEAQANGALASTPQQTVIKEEQVIRIEPSDPTYIYVPTYDPYAVYAPGASWAAPALTFGLGMATGAWLNNGCNWWGGCVTPYRSGFYCGPGGGYNRYVNNNINVNRNEFFSNNSWKRNTNIGNGNRVTHYNGGNRTNLDRGRVNNGNVPTWRAPNQHFNNRPSGSIGTSNWPRTPNQTRARTTTQPTRTPGRVPTLNNPVHVPNSAFQGTPRSGDFNRARTSTQSRNRGYSSLNSRPNTGGFNSSGRSYNRSSGGGRSYSRPSGGGRSGGGRSGGGRRR